MNLKQTQSNWELLAKTDPLYGVLSHQGKRGGKWGEAEFFGTGVAEIAELLEQAGRMGLTFPRGRALDFGCGVGRLSQALAAHFSEVTGVDISPAMLSLAEKYNQAGTRCKYLLNDRADLSLFPDSSFDLIYTNIVLQHMAPDIALGYLPEFLRVLSPQGLLAFQLPERPQYPAWRLAIKKLLPKPLLGLYRRLRYGTVVPARVEIEMNGVSSRRVLEVLEQAGGQVKHHGMGWYYAVKGNHADG